MGAMMYSENPKAVSVYRPKGHRPDGGIQPGAVPTARQNANSFCFCHE
jgi:hypothetical protein